MPRIVRNALNAVAVQNLAKRGEVGRHAAGEGLYLHVTSAGAAKWSLRYMLSGRAREMGLGRFSADAAKGVTLAEARVRARAIRTKLDAKIDPLAERSAEAEARRAEEKAERAAAAIMSRERTFQAAFMAWLEAHGPAMRTERQRQLAAGQMRKHVLPHIGARPVAGLTTADMQRVLEPIWRKLPETAFRVRIRCEAVFAWARAAGWRDAPNPAIWKDNLAPLLGQQGEAARVTHHRALPWREVPDLMQQLAADATMTSLALRFCVLTAARTGEVLGATWSEIRNEGADGPVWIVPPERMKMRLEHRVPLSAAALAVLALVKPLRTHDAPGGGFLFPGGAGRRGGLVAGGRRGAIPGGLSNMALLIRLRDMGMAQRTTVHGLRSSFRDWTAECTATPEAVAEAALAHTVGSAVRRAYQRSDMLEQRRALMESWGAFCTAPIEAGADQVGGQKPRVEA
jgi:integrase